MKRLSKALSLLPVIVILLNGCTSSIEDGLPGSDDQTVTYHSSGWKDNPQHGNDYYTDPQNCSACHGEDLDGGTSGVSCRACHHSGWTGTHGEEYAADPDKCKACHGDDLNDCSSCHHEDAVGKWQHGDYHTLPDTDNCADCHGADLTGANSLVSCFSCHSDISAFNCSNCHTGAAISYADSAHGNTSYGVDRSETGTEGDCIHCHDLPAGSTNDLLLFAPMNQTSQTENFCFQCHKDTGDNPVQIGMPQQRSYSYRAGGWTADPLDDVKEAFSSTSSHNLDNILTFITGRWGYTSDSNPCAACHNPHAAQRDPHVAGDRGWPATLPSKHGSSVAGEQLWGDDTGEKMSDYTSFYKAPYRSGSTTTYEPDASATTTDGSNLTSYVTFCQDCHTTDMGLAPYDFGLTNTPIDWTTTGDDPPSPLGGDKHGKNIATGNTHYLNVPYTWTASGFVLSCTDCHEPHGASNEMLVREEVNGAQVTIGSIGSDDVDLAGLCLRCHQNNIWSIHHTDSGNANAPYTGGEDCNDCHSLGWNTGPTSICSNCHFHSGDDGWLQTSPDIANGNLHYTGRRTF